MRAATLRTLWLDLGNSESVARLCSCTTQSTPWCPSGGLKSTSGHITLDVQLYVLPIPLHAGLHAALGARVPQTPKWSSANSPGQCTPMPLCRLWAAFRSLPCLIHVIGCRGGITRGLREATSSQGGTKATPSNSSPCTCSSRTILAQLALDALAPAWQPCAAAAWQKPSSRGLAQLLSCSPEQSSALS